jgi:N-acetylmuramoyl-L-alanine amidase
MKKRWLLAAILGLWVIGAVGEGMAAPRLMGVRKFSGPEFTRVVLDLEAPPTYETQSVAGSFILSISLQKVTLPQGAREIQIEDQVIRKIKIDRAEKDGARVVLFLVQPTRWKVFVLQPAEGKPDRLVIDVFRPTGEVTGKVEKQESGISEQEPGETKPPAGGVEKPEGKPAAAEPQEEANLPVKTEKPLAKPADPQPSEKKTPPKAEEPPREEGTPTERGLARLAEIRHWSAPDHTQVVADLEGTPAYEVLPQTEPLVYTLQLRGILILRGKHEIPVGDQVIGKIRVEPEGRNEAKLSLFLIQPARLNVFLLNPFEDKPNRLVIDVSRPDLEAKEKEQRQFTRELKARKKRIVVIDPGHGGDDPGAVGPRKTLEKDIVLALAQNLQEILDSTGEIRAFLTRRGDYFVPLNDRVKIAQEYGADLFISLHANGSRSRQTRGTSVYCLSLKGASDKATQLLAQEENASDMVGGTSLAPTQRDLDTILLDLEQTHAINESLHMGGLALNEMGRVNRIQFSQPRQAGFAVLMAPEFPSILVETAYITHRTEEMLLRKKSFQDRICQAIAAAVKRYIPIMSVKEGRPGGDSFEVPSKKGRE